VNEYLLLMHGDSRDPELAGNGELWASYLGRLRASGRFDGGSSIGTGAIYGKGREPVAVTNGVSGFLRIRAASLDEASSFLAGNPVFEAGGTIELRELLRD
jgi:hypothetical protein